MRKLIEFLLAFIVGLIIAALLFGPSVRSEPLKIYVNNAAGGSIDSVARILTQNLDSVIVNQPIADGRIALDHTLMDENSLFISSFSILQFKDIIYVKPVAYIASIPFYVTVSPKLASLRFNNFIDREDITCGSIGYKGITKIVMKKLYHLGMDNCVYVTYRSVIDALRDMRLGILDSTVVSKSLADNFGLKQYKESEYLFPIGIWSSPRSDNEKYNQVFNDILKDKKIRKQIEFTMEARDFRILTTNEFEKMIDDSLYSFQE